ncbi:MAG: hypothetical protein AABP62_15850 [Planctomycetota bacterium]
MRLERIAPKRRQETDEEPRFCGKPRHVAIADYAAWLGRRINDAGRSDAERAELRQRVAELTAHAEELRRDVEGDF